MQWRRCGVESEEGRLEQYGQQWTLAAVGGCGGVAELEVRLAGDPRNLRPVSPLLLLPGTLTSDIPQPLPPLLLKQPGGSLLPCWDPHSVAGCRQLQQPE
ncbi:hypothetical protein NDU88_000677 [Pleurodeles waltl]|uniref:Uncharacterized protein n=1 Tax=Pleurodeles waltl TaxID=8319 RepID=A0AAV7THF9_PLEWA|nr:hypothetical protein NDU88_000677 [Pleurodeles waltl]